MVDMHIPEEIVSNILLRLPAKPMLRFRSVSKQWNSLISDPQFMKTRSRRMVLVSVSPLKSIDYNVPVNDTANSAIKLDCPFIYQECKVKIVGSVGGIVCLLISNSPKNSPRPTTLIMYNPFTRVSRLLREIDSGFVVSSCGHAYGLGYDISNPNDLKVVKLDFDAFGSIYNLFSLKDGSWRSGPLILHSDTHISNIYVTSVGGTFMNGFLHWKAYNSMHKVHKIAALDVTKMVFSEIDLPPQCYPIWYSPIRVLDGCLCIVSSENRSAPDSYDVWLMNEHGVSSSWSKLCSLPVKIADTLYIAPSCCLENEKFVVFRYHYKVSDDELPDDNMYQVFIYDWRKGSFEALNDVSAPSYRNWQIGAIEYVESLTSLNELI